jgi:TonB family protein
MQTSCIYAQTICALAVLLASLPAAAQSAPLLDAGASATIGRGLASAADAGGPTDASDAGVAARATDASAASEGGRAGAASSSAGGDVQLVPPRLLASAAPVYPAAHLSHGEHPTVVLKVTILADGSVTDVNVEHSAGPDFDAAAIEAVRQWTFAAARRGDQAIASRIGIAVHFDLPELGAIEVAAVTGAREVVPHPHDEQRPHASDGAVDKGAYGALAQVEVEREEQRGTNDYRLAREQLEVAPHAGAAELLKGAPGLVVARIEGDAVGHRLMMRGFDADHGQDIELSVDGVPVNQPSHIHGQGYADLGFVIPETVHSLRVVEGVYDPAQGDFAVAGSADFELGVAQRGVRLSSSYGAFDSFRELALWAPRGEPRETFAAVLMQKSAGFGQNRAATSGALVAQGALGSGRVRLLLHGSLYAARARTANVLRRDDVDRGVVGFYDVYPYPTAQAQHGSALRAQLGAKLRYVGENGAHGELSLYSLWNDFRLLANYTGFVERSREMAAWSGRGDLTEQLNDARTLGVRGRYRTERYHLSDAASATLELGLSGRVDRIEQAQNLLEAPSNSTWDRRVDAAITAGDVGLYLDLDLTVTRFVRLKGGVRADLLAYRVGDALQNFIPAYRREEHIVGYRRGATGIAAGPRVVLEVTPIAPLTLSAAYGEGYRSPQALLLDEDEPAPFTKVRSSDLGMRLLLGSSATLRASGYYTKLGQDVVFEPTEGRAEAAGPSSRLGAVIHAELRPLAWLRGSGSATYVRATLDEPPPRTAEDPSPPFERGQRLPYVPPWVIRFDVGAEHRLAEWSRGALRGRAGVGFTHWSRRPLPYAAESAPVSLLDGALALSYRDVSLDLSIFNLLDARYAALELSAASNWDAGAVPSRLPARHVIAGAPRTWLLTLGARL